MGNGAMSAPVDEMHSPLLQIQVWSLAPLSLKKQPIPPRIDKYVSKKEQKINLKCSPFAGEAPARPGITALGLTFLLDYL
jgi:hypothetical protein